MVNPHLQGMKQIVTCDVEITQDILCLEITVEQLTDDSEHFRKSVSKSMGLIS
jgi:hypothetical protein